MANVIWACTRRNGKRMSVRIGRYGPFVQIGENDDEQKLYASLRSGQMIESISLEDALELFKLPKKAGAFEEKRYDGCHRQIWAIHSP